MNTNLKKIISFRTLLILGIAACFCCIIPFSREIIISLMEAFLGRPLRDVNKWTDILVHSMFFFITIMVFWIFFWYTAKGKIIADDISNTIKKTFSESFTKKYLFALAVIFLACYSALILANYEYADDIRRVYSGHKAWVGWSRYVSEILAVFLHTNFFINDISPIAQIWTILILSIMSYIFVYAATDGKVTKLALLASTFAGLSPFYLANFSYKFDCPYMALAMLFGVLPFLFTSNRKSYIVMSFISLVLVCTSYQAANSIYIILAIFTAFKMWSKKDSWKNIGIFAAVSILSYCAALIFFRILLMNTFDGNAVSRGTGIATGASALVMIKTNFFEYIHCIGSGYGNLWIKGFTVLSIIFFPISAVLHHSNRSKVSAFFVSIAVLFGMFALSFGAYLVLEQALISSRTFMGFDILIALISIFNSNCVKEIPSAKKINGVIIICLLYGLGIEAVIYGNFTNKQKEYENFRFGILINDLSNIIDSNAENSIYIGGITGVAGKTRMEQKNYPMNGGTISPVLSQYLLKDKNMFFEILSEDTLDELDLQPEFKKQLTELPLIKDSYYHTIYGKDNQYYVYLKNPQKKE